jgi:DNA-binding response OmpR family regulator
MPVTILLADDDADLVEGLRWYLEAVGHRVVTAEDGEQAVRVFLEEDPDLAILDIMMPGLDGVEVCETIRSKSDAMVMILSARDGEIDKVRAFSSGADDYVTKPFNVSELVARVQALMRRSPRGAGPANLYRWRNLSVSPDEHCAAVDGAPVDLTAMEFTLLVTMMRKPRVVQPREALIDAIWGSEFFGEQRLVDNLVYRLREKLAGAGCADFPIATIRGVGYAYRPET